MDTNNKTIQTKETTMSDMKDRVMQVILAEADVEKGFIPDHAKNKFSDNSENLKCPFCQQELEIVFQQVGHNLEESYLLCNKCNLRAERKLWQELIKLMEENKCTRKALDVAIRGLDQMTWGCDSSDAEHLLKEIKEITAEQKDVK